MTANRLWKEWKQHEIDKSFITLCRKGDWKDIKLAIKNGANVNAVESRKEKQPVLMILLRRKDVIDKVLDIVKYFIICIKR